MRLIINIPIILFLLFLGYVGYTQFKPEPNISSAKCAWDAPINTQHVKNFLASCTPSPIADIRFENKDGSTSRFSDYRGKVLVVNFWATWCGPCRTEIPYLEELQQSFDKNKVEVIAYSIDEGGMYEPALFLNTLGVKNITHVHDTYRQALPVLGVGRYPTTIIIDAEGNYLGKYEGLFDWTTRSGRDLIVQALNFSNIEAN